MKTSKLTATPSEVDQLTDQVIDMIRRLDTTTASTYEIEGYKSIRSRTYIHGDARMIVQAVLTKAGVQLVPDEAADSITTSPRWTKVCVAATIAFVLGLIIWNATHS